MKCQFCEQPAVFAIEGFEPQVLEIFVCRDHYDDGKKLLDKCQYIQVVCLDTDKEKIDEETEPKVQA